MRPNGIADQMVANVFVLGWKTDIMRKGNLDRAFQLIPAENSRYEILIISWKTGFCG